MGRVISRYHTVLGWIRRKCLSWRYDVTRGLSLRGLSFVIPVCRRIVILNTLKWTATAWRVIPAWTIPTLAHGHFNGAMSSTFLLNSNFQNGKLFTLVASTINDRRWFKWLIRSSQTRSWDGEFIFRIFFFGTEQDLIVCFVRINAFNANIDVNDNKQLFWS